MIPFPKTLYITPLIQEPQILLIVKINILKTFISLWDPEHKLKFMKNLTYIIKHNPHNCVKLEYFYSILLMRKNGSLKEINICKVTDMTIDELDYKVNQISTLWNPCLFEDLILSGFQILHMGKEATNYIVEEHGLWRQLLRANSHTAHFLTPQAL